MRHRMYGGVGGRSREAPPTRSHQPSPSPAFLLEGLGQDVKTNGALQERQTCARHGTYLGGESPLLAVEDGRASLGKGVHREMESERS